MAISGPPTPKLAPPPDFRYVGLGPGPRTTIGMWASLLGIGATAAAALSHGFASRDVLYTAIGSAVAALALRRVSGPRAGRAWRVKPVPMAIVPWGILVDPDERPRVLRWAAIKSVHVEMIHGRDQATPTTLWSVVTVETPGERLAGRAAGTVSLDRLVVHLQAYAEEAAHVVALDLDGEAQGDGPIEPEVEPLLQAARAYVESAPASQRLGLPVAGYRRAAARAAGPTTAALLRDVLRDRTPRAVDPRAFAAVVAAELCARELTVDLVALAQSPHPVLAAVAKVAALKLGADVARVGALDEVVPFLSAADAEALQEWLRA